LRHDWVILDSLYEDVQDLAELMREKQEKAQKNYLSIMPKYNGRKK